MSFKRKPRKIPSWPDCTFGSYTALVNCTKGIFRSFVWPDEGEFLKTDSFKFNEEHAGEYEPLAIDNLTARMLLALHDALNEENQAKFKEWIAKDRGHFAALIEMAREKVKCTGFESRQSSNS